MYFLTLITFLVGIGAGVYTFLITRDDVIPILPPAGAQTSGFEVVAYAYGGCEREGCSTYRINERGVYTYKEQGDGERREGELNEAAVRELKAVFKGTALSEIAESVALDSCPAYVDGIAYRYEIREGDKQYQLDSCVQDVRGELFILLEKYFDVFSTAGYVKE